MAQQFDLPSIMPPWWSVITLPYRVFSPPQSVLYWQYKTNDNSSLIYIVLQMGQPRPHSAYFRPFQQKKWQKIVDFNGNQTRIVRAEGKHVDHLTTTSAQFASLPAEGFELISSQSLSEHHMCLLNLSTLRCEI